MADNRTKKKTWPRVVALELLQSWQDSRRKGDPELMAETLGYSRPVIDRALLYGYISMPELTAKITKFFADRLEAERQQAKELQDLKNADQ